MSSKGTLRQRKKREGQGPFQIEPVIPYLEGESANEGEEARWSLAKEIKKNQNNGGDCKGKGA